MSRLDLVMIPRHLCANAATNLLKRAHNILGRVRRAGRNDRIPLHRCRVNTVGPAAPRTPDVSKLDDLDRTIAAASAEEQARTRYYVILRATYLARVGEDRRPGLFVPVETLRPSRSTTKESRTRTPSECDAALLQAGATSTTVASVRRRDLMRVIAPEPPNDSRLSCGP